MTHLPLDDALRLVVFSSEFDCEFVKRLLSSHLERRVEDDGWNTYVLASHLDDPYLAKIAIRPMNNDERWAIVGDWSLKLDDQPTFFYLIAFVNAILTNRYAIDDDSCRWDKVAETSRPPRRHFRNHPGLRYN